ncbi:TolC family protein [Candidatus Uabimicrobium sp. HlEnr_7]|uniref:TolC family protein n=1 Tax=Candidatus Uabimicrobium helgolandensis TaxID=3095367 RepID=UPI003558A259
MIKIVISLCLLITSCTPYWGKAEKIDTIVNDRKEMLTDYSAQIENLESKPKEQKKEVEKPQIDVRTMEWFQNLVEESKGSKNPVSLEDLYLTSLVNSKQIQVFADIPIIRKTGIQEAEGRFNLTGFADGGYNRVNEAVGNDLKIGDDNVDRFIEDETFIEFGLRKIFITGGEAVLTQKLSRLQNNSEFFDPSPQSLATLTFRFTQPLLKGGGVTYNESAIVLAQLDTEIAQNEFKRQLEAHFLEISAAYWDLYLSKINFFMRKKMINNIQAINTEMTQRSNIDALRSQIYHTEAAIAFHRTQLIRAEVAVRNAQDRLMSLVSSPKFREYGIEELAPLDHPLTEWVDVDVKESAKLALKNRPELEQAFLQLRSAKVRLNMTKNELLPIFDVFAEIGLSGIADDVDIPGAWEDEFTGGEPGFRVGFHLEFPFANDTARARKLRREIEKRQLRHQFESSVESILLEIKVSVREVKSAYQEFLSSQKAFIAAKNEVESLQSRFKFDTLLGENPGGVSAFLQIMLQAQNVYADSQLALVKNLVNYNLAITRLKKAEGTFLSYKNVEINEIKDADNLPMLRARVKAIDEATPENWKK